MKTFKITFVRSAFQTCTSEFLAETRQAAAERAWEHMPNHVQSYTDQPELASYEIEKIVEVKPCKPAKKSG